MQPPLKQGGGAAGCAEKPAGEAPQKPGVKSRLIGVAIGGLLALHGTLNAFIYKKFTPVYTATECGDQIATMDEFELGTDTIHVGLLIQVTCKNPNPYRIQILASTPGEVYIGEDKLKVGSLTVIPGSHLEEHGGGNVRVRMSADIHGQNAVDLLPHFLEDRAIPIFMGLQFSVGISIPFGPLLAFKTTAPFRKECGMNMQGLLVSSFVSASGGQSRLGPLVCRESFEALVIPEVDDKDYNPSAGQMGFTAAQVAPLEVARGELLKNVSLGLVITLSYLLAVLVPIHFWTVGPSWPSQMLKHWWRRWRSSGDRLRADHERLDLVGSRDPLRDPDKLGTFLLGADLEAGYHEGTPLTSGVYTSVPAEAASPRTAPRSEPGHDDDVRSARDAAEAEGQADEPCGDAGDDGCSAHSPHRARSKRELSPQPSCLSLRANSSSTLPARGAHSKWSLATSLNGLKDSDDGASESPSRPSRPSISLAAKAAQIESVEAESGDAAAASAAALTSSSSFPPLLDPPPRPTTTTALVHVASRNARLAEASIDVDL